MRKTRWVRRARWVLVPFLACGLYLGGLQLVNNFHESIPGVFYRSAQVSPAELVAYEKQYGIKSVINLRGDNHGTPWYDAELQTAELLGVEHMDFRMSAGRELTKGQALELIEMMRNAPKPMLVHCMSGADRTGLAAALYFAAIAKRSEWASERQLWPIYGHLPLRFIDAYAMNRTFESLEPYLGFGNS